MDALTFRRTQIARTRASKIVASLQWGESSDAKDYYSQGWRALATLRSGEKDERPLLALEAKDNSLAYARQCYGGPSWGLKTQEKVNACYTLAFLAAKRPLPAYYLDAFSPPSLPEHRVEEE